MKIHFVALLVLFCVFLQDGEAAPKTCLELLKYDHEAHQSGLYEIDPDGQGPFKVYCDMETDGGGWTVFQRRQDGSQDFYLNWADYKNGFGDLKKEFYLGNDRIHRMTAAAAHRLRIDMEDFEFNTRHAGYGSFSIGNEGTKYKLTVSGYSGNAGDSMSVHNGQKFSTKDQDNDSHKAQSCAVAYKGAWWYNGCHESNLNGLYLRGPHTSSASGVSWYKWKGPNYSLKVTVMKIRPVNY